MAQKLVYCEPDVFNDLSEKYWRDVSTAMKRYSRESAIRMEELFMGAPLPGFFETQLGKDLSYFSRP
jgi:hypothetical protein